MTHWIIDSGRSVALSGFDGCFHIKLELLSTRSKKSMLCVCPTAFFSTNCKVPSVHITFRYESDVHHADWYTLFIFIACWLICFTRWQKFKNIFVGREIDVTRHRIISRQKGTRSSAVDHRGWYCWPWTDLAVGLYQLFGYTAGYTANPTARSVKGVYIYIYLPLGFHQITWGEVVHGT